MHLAVLFCTALLFGQDKPPEKVTLPTSPEDLARGKALYMGSCTYCHGPTGDGGKGADLARSELSRAKTDGDLARLIEVGIPGSEMPAAWHMTRREVTQVAAFVRTLGKVETKPVPGDRARGQEHFAKQGCSNCHTVRDGDRHVGGLMGPDLSFVGTRRSAAHLRESVVNPGIALPEGFVNSVVTLKSGKTMKGQLLSEDAFRVVFRDFSGGNMTIAREDIKEVKRLPKESPMPSYQGKLSPSELDDLIAYMVSLKEPK